LLYYDYQHIASTGILGLWSIVGLGNLSNKFDLIFVKWSTILSEDIVEPEFRLEGILLCPGRPGILRLRFSSYQPPVNSTNAMLFENG
jgi:hypothetical protein